MAFSEYGKNLMLGAVPATVYVAFFTGGAPGTGTEVVPATLWGSGDRPEVALETASGGSRTPDGDAAIGTVAIASQAVDHIAYYDAATGGNLIASGAYSRTLVSGDVVSYPDANNVFVLND